jgi:hypothetical protein
VQDAVAQRLGFRVGEGVVEATSAELVYEIDSA